jgi:hypothetical protein
MTLEDDRSNGIPEADIDNNRVIPVLNPDQATAAAFLLAVILLAAWLMNKLVRSAARKFPPI